MKKLILALFIMLVFVSTALATVHEVDTAAEFTTALGVVDPGDSIHILNGSYNNWGTFDITRDGSDGNEIIIYATNQGDVTFTGTIRINIKADYIVLQNLDFNGAGDYYLIVIGDSSYDAHHCQITYCRFYDCTNIGGSLGMITILQRTQWLEVDHCLFDGFDSSYAISTTIEGTHPRDVTIDNNTFQNSTGYCAVKTGGTDASTSYIIEYNTFDNLTNNNAEIITNKTSDNIIRYNDFVDCINSGNTKAVSIRGGDDCQIYGNTFSNVDRPIRVQGDGHVIYNNITYDFSYGMYFTLGGPGYTEATNCIIAYNTFIGLTGDKIIKIDDAGVGGTVKPSSNKMYNNIFIADDGDFLLSDWTTNNVTDTNLFDELSDEPITDPMGTNEIEDDADLTGLGIASRLTSGSAAVNAAADVPNWSDPTNDIDNDSVIRPQGGTRDIGCDEYDQNPTMSSPQPQGLQSCIGGSPATITLEVDGDEIVSARCCKDDSGVTCDSSTTYTGMASAAVWEDYTVTGALHSTTEVSEVCGGGNVTYWSRGRDATNNDVTVSAEHTFSIGGDPPPPTDIEATCYGVGGQASFN